MSNVDKSVLRAACAENPGQMISLCADDVLALLDELHSSNSRLHEVAVACANAEFDRDWLRVEIVRLKSQLKACHPFRPAQEIKP